MHKAAPPSHVEFIANLVSSHSLLREKVTRANGGRICPADDLTRRIGDSLDGLGDDVGALLGSGAYEDWYTKGWARAAIVRQHRAIYILLDRIDRHYGNLRPIAYRLKDGQQIALGRRFWKSDRKSRTVRDNRADFEHVRLSGRAGIQYHPVHPHLRTGFDRAGASVTIRLHSLRRDSVAFFSATEVVDQTKGIMGFRLEDVRRMPAADGADTHPDYDREIAEATGQACADGVHILCFPELYITKKAHGLIHETLRTSASPDLFMVVAGSTHHESKGSWVNGGPLFARRAENVVHFADSQKSERAGFPTNGLDGNPGTRGLVTACGQCRDVLEDIVPSPAYTVIGTPIGFVGIVICKDALTGESELGDLCRWVDHLVVVSMNSSAGWFQPKLELLVRTHRIGCYYVNGQHSASMQPGVECAGWIYPKRLQAPADSRFFYPAGHGKTEEQVTPAGNIDLKLALSQ